MDQFRLGQLQGLEGSMIPLFPVLKTIEYITANGVKHKLQCRQVALDGAYAFTDYQAQAIYGRTLAHLSMHMSLYQGHMDKTTYI